jgi:drug/metabolite transporter (DMT)-like permease
MLKFILLLLMTMLGALGSYFFKRVTSKGIGLHKTFMVNLFIGGTLYVCGALFNIILLKYIPYTVVYPLSSITYIWTLIFSYFLLSEKITKRKVAGVCCIIVGAAIIGM